jgi:uncharacterized membrane protein YkvA (DUF1232 family)
MTTDFALDDTLGFLASKAKHLGRSLVVHGFKLWLAIQAPTTPVAVKAPLIAALIYIGMPIDAVPDVLPVVGFSDDLAVAAAALAAAHMHITPDIAAEAERRAASLFG